MMELPHYYSSTGSFYYDRDSTDSSAAESLYGYDDFDPNECLQTIHSMIQRKQRSSAWQQDAAAMAAMYLTRGTSIFALRTTCGDEIADLISSLMNIYELGLSRQPKGVLTIARVCMTLAGNTVAGAIALKDRLPVPHSHMTAMVPDYPAAMMTTAFCGLIPQGEAYTETIRDAHYLYVATLVKRIDFLLLPKPNWEIVDSFEELSLAVERKHPHTQVQRVSLLEMLGILAGGVCSEAVTNAAELFRKEYRRPRPGLDSNPGNFTN